MVSSATIKAKPVRAYHHFSGLMREMVMSNKLVVSFSESAWHPPTDVYETPGEIIVKVEIAGVRAHDIEMKIDKKCLVIRGRRDDAATSGRRSFRQMELKYGAFERVIPLDSPIDAEACHASYNNGFLEVILPKTKHAKPAIVQIEIS
jgi:HSP20 family protein